jgi:uncharacterized glyoxalase superfamily protein PhnB
MGPTWRARRVSSAARRPAEVLREPTDQDYGSRDFSVRDPEGFVWSLGTYRPE